MTDMFTNRSDLTGLLESIQNILVSDALHKAIIEVNEKGTEAAAVTGIFLFQFVFNMNN